MFWQWPRPPMGTPHSGAFRHRAFYSNCNLWQQSLSASHGSLPWIVWLGGGVLGWVAGDLVVDDTIIRGWIGSWEVPFHWALPSYHDDLGVWPGPTPGRANSFRARKLYVRTHRPFAVAWIRKNAPADSHLCQAFHQGRFKSSSKPAEFCSCQGACFLLDI